MWADLHLHSTFSDGILTPTEIIKIASKIGIQTLAITDHDTTSGLAEAQKAALDYHINFVSGIEISAIYKNDAFHILGCFIDPQSEELQNKLELYRQARHQRNQKMILKLQELGITITEEEVVQLSGKKIFGRPHIARLLVKKGIVRNIKMAFYRYLGLKGKAYTPKEFFSPEESIAIIHQAGGKAFLAHPASLKLKNYEQRSFFKNLKEIGMDGIEVYTSVHNAEQILLFQNLAKEYNFLISGGSDYHDQNNPETFIGTCQQGMRIKQEWLASCFHK